MKNCKIIWITSVASLLLSSQGFAEEDIVKIATTSGCFVCHSIQPLNLYNDPNAILPVGSDYEKISIKYREDKDGYNKLFQILKKGKGNYRIHWESTIDNLTMPSNVLLDEQYIDKLVKWILSLARHQTELKE